MTGDSVNSLKEGETSSNLLRRVQAKDVSAWERFVHLYSPLIYKWCRSNGLQDADAADVGQEVLTAVAAAIVGFRQGNLRGWLRRICFNKIIDFHRRRQADTQATGGSDARAALEQVPIDISTVDCEPNDVESKEDELILYRRAVEIVLSEFEETTRKAFLAYAVEKRLPRDVAAELGITVNTVYLSKSRVLRRLREEFSDLVDLD